MDRYLYLSHHGIKGQKWGIRRFQNEDGTLTALGKDRYGVDKAKLEYIEAKEKVKKYRKAYLLGDEKAYAKYRRSYNAKVRAKNDYKDTKTYALIKEQNVVSKRQKKLISEYMAKGYTQKEAELAAYRRDKAEKIAVAALGVSVAAISAYGAYKYADYAFDKILDSKTPLSRVTTNSDSSVHDAFYAVLNKAKNDKIRYKGLYANQLAARGNNNVYEKIIDINAPIKMASRKNAKKLVGAAMQSDRLFQGELMTDPTIALLYKRKYGDLGTAYLIQDTKRAVESGKLNNSLYDAMNIALVDRSSASTKLFYNALRSAGYGAVKDVNDSKYSGFNTKLPIIVFDSAKVQVRKVRELTRWKRDLNMEAYLKLRDRESIMSASMAALPSATLWAGACVFGTAKILRENKDEIVSEYRSEHPNSKLSYNQIIENYFNEN